MLPLKVFQAALEAPNSLITPEIPLVILEKACCPIPVRIPKPSPLLILLPKLDNLESAFSIVEVNPLSAADNIAFTLKLSAIFLTSFSHEFFNFRKFIFFFSKNFIKFIFIVKELLESIENWSSFIFTCFLSCFDFKIIKR